MGMTHGERDTFPRTGRCPRLLHARAGGRCRREDRHRAARLGQPREPQARAPQVHDRGPRARHFRAEVEKRLGYKLGEPRPFEFTSTGDVIGWEQGADKKWHLTLFVENGRVKDLPGWSLRTALREIAEVHPGGFVVTANQNVIIANVPAKAKAKIEAILKEHGIAIGTDLSGLRRNSMACVALPTCGLALAESERFLPELLTALEESLDKAGLKDDEIVIRMTGCPNGCARPYLAEIGLVGRNPGLYNLYLGAAFNGSRLNKLYAEDVDKARIVRLLGADVRALRQGARGGRALRRLRHSCRLRARDDGGQPLPRRPGPCQSRQLHLRPLSGAWG